MSVAAAIQRLQQFIEDRVNDVAPFRATVTSVSGGLVGIKRQGATTADTRTYARTAGIAVAVNDEVLCVPLSGQPVIIARLQRSAPALLPVEAPIEFQGANPTVTAGANAGTGASVSSSTGSDAAMRVVLDTGTGAAIGTLLTVTFSQDRGSSTYIVTFGAGDHDAADVIAAGISITNRASTGFDVLTWNTAPASSTNFVFYVQVTWYA